MSSEAGLDPFNKQKEKCQICQHVVTKVDSFKCFSIDQASGGIITKICLTCLFRVDITNHIDYVDPSILLLLKATLDKVVQLENKMGDYNNVP